MTLGIRVSAYEWGGVHNRSVRNIDLETELCVQRVYWEMPCEGTREGSRIGQKEQLDGNGVVRETSADRTGGFGAGIALQSVLN